MELTIRKPDDFHVHLRDGEMLATVLPYTAKQFARALIMPNLKPEAIRTAQDLISYRARILAQGTDLTPLMTIKITDETTPDSVSESFQDGAIAGKVYPTGSTTNAEDGVSDFGKLRPVFEEMEALGMVLCLHGEIPDVFCFYRETTFLSVLYWLTEQFPELKIVVEHITGEEIGTEIEKLPSTVAATITAHHLVLTLDHVLGGKFKPHNFCKPIPKRPQDLMWLMQAATSGNPKFFFGSDSAPHPREKKECAEGEAGVFTAPVVLAILAQQFEAFYRLERLENFVSRFGAQFYGLPLNNGTLTLVKEPWQVPEEIGGVVPLKAGEMLEWQVK
ncbi:hypothetical protein A3B21_04040 [Candidatus Uhrbacteria bacterium RIFCSPLOWO2_01_FULL_47_24]|uniref:Dihydroorotase n=1 Tax=Candidatus Uhrbacteria bacterium RIFCSPLOWO2_01_FULL_47_24 TaxID=1802401 RepID=A0A1F7UT98_9BACT|nr:MAG: hypothetical protein A2753_01185 [Candidatus Uhrbacteria bacterium RIFCSPHIGHO2_01_FULL_47_11]OGL69141.1 MAG: hypothetical protein A3D58_02745 [Candidatus Uhrbacteria bacterium RIFCSPHIGHO2_02_FULL_46_47]OGL74788.1 MAG: hypothetical protein A3F52_04500 [Candidatus Uhrbacteria bacterium RIFCSPHIGHO2_12_FULL_47_11]OGL81512.1 MAG: hypothetical protein A3B21_04040 [Candidatus Uhrbacteria bacterium RIFCSPLOWO2_01_FULL_47_24]OGL83757.1 MAG: hypothetical protein A3J03_01495 [Candidatus Uhrbact